MVWLLADRVKNLIEKKWPVLLNNVMITGGLRMTNGPFIPNLSHFPTAVWRGYKLIFLYKDAGGYLQKSCNWFKIVT